MKQRSLLIDACRSVRPVIWMLLCVPVLLFMLAVDRFWPEYESVMIENEENTLRLQRAKVQADMLPKFHEHIEADKERFQYLSGKAYTAADVEQSISQFSSDLTRIFSAVYIQPDSTVAVSVVEQREGTALLQASVSFNCVPQQLQALEVQLLAQSHLIKVTSIVAKVGPDTLRDSQQLLVQLNVQAIHHSVPEPQINPKTAKPTL